jgi:hypothetical protein
MREDKFETDLLSKPIANERKEELDPVHKRIKQSLALALYLVHKAIKRLFMSLHEVDKQLHSLIWIPLAHYETSDIFLQESSYLQVSQDSMVLMRSVMKFCKSPNESAMLAALYT